MAHIRTIIAFLVAPLVIPFGLSVAVFSVAIVFSPRISPAIVTDFLSMTAMYSRYALPIAYVVELVLGFPAWLLFRRRGIRAWSAYAAGGATLGMAYYVAYSAVKYVSAKTIGYDFVGHPLTRDANPGNLWLAVSAGLASAILFRAIVFPRNPKKTKSAKSW